MLLDSQDSLNLASGQVYEPQEVALVQQIIQAGDVVIDIGANIGYYTLLFASLVGETGEVLAFEPDPQNFAILQQNVALNHYSQVILEPKALSYSASQSHLYLCHENHGMHRLYPSVCCQDNVLVETVALDAYLANYERDIDFIKIDIEGAEYAAVQGMQRTLRRFPNLMLLTEFSPAALFEFGIDPQNYVQLLIEQDFHLYTLIDERWSLVDIADLFEQLQLLNQIMTHTLPQLQGKKSTSAVVETVLDALHQHRYPRPLTENFLCSRQRLF